MIKKINNSEEVLEFICNLSNNDFYASYPRRYIREIIKDDIETSIRQQNCNVIGYYSKDKLCGVCDYFWKYDQKYAQTSYFLINENYDKIAKEMINYIRNQLAGYELYIGFPFSNENANQYFTKNNIECIESSIVTNLYNLDLLDIEMNDNLYRVDIHSFDEYAKFHDKHAIPLKMYYDSSNIKKEMNRFCILIYKCNNVICGSIFTKVDKDLSDVVGLFIDEEYKNKGIESILISEMLVQLYKECGAVKEILYFIDEDCNEELKIALNLGFKVKENYRCYRCLL